jgi:acyl-CoA synthetase (NDP forming)
MMPMSPLDECVVRATEGDRSWLAEHEVLDLIDAVGLPTPRRRFVATDRPADASQWRDLPFERGVLKAIGHGLQHKTEQRALRFVTCADSADVAQRAAEMIAGLSPSSRAALIGVLMEEQVAVEPILGRELYVGLRDAEALGPVLTVGFGGAAIEALSGALRPEAGVALWIPGVTREEHFRQRVEESLWFRAATGQVRGVPAACDGASLHAEIRRWLTALEQIAEAVSCRGKRLRELELNPLGFGGDRWLPLDGLATFGPTLEPRAPVAQDKLRRALRPRSIAIVGASQSAGDSVGRIILRNLVDGGYSPSQLAVVHPRAERIEAVRCAPSLDAVGEPVDLLILALPAAEVPAAIERAIHWGSVATVLVIAGGMGETEQGRPIEQRIRQLLQEAPRAHRPVVIGNNSLGLVCRRARVDSLFIPPDKLPRAGTRSPGVALCSQSGAFSIAQLSRLTMLAPDYLLSIGNQVDASAADFLDALSAEEAVGTAALYLEGIPARAGLRLCRITREMTHAGRDVIVYLAGRSELGETATRGHTGSVAGDALVNGRALADAGALVADSLDEFVELLELSATLRTKQFGGRRAALMSNAGYEAVTMADRCAGAADQLVAAPLTDSTRALIGRALADAGLSKLVRASNPLDVTPMADDEVHERCARALLADPTVDLAVLGAVPFTARMQTSGDPGADGYAARMARLFDETPKPLCVVVDAGPGYEPLRLALRRAGLPVLSRADDAVLRLGRYAAHRVRWSPPTAH